MAGSQIVVPTSYNLQDRSSSSSAYWIEQVENAAPTSDEFSPKYSSTSLTAFVAPGQTAMYNFLNQVLGYHYTDGSNTLVRKNPEQHPKYPWLYAARVTNSHGIKFTGRAEGNFAFADANSLKDFATYDRNLVTVDFAPARWSMKTADKITTGGVVQEWKRYVEYSIEPNLYDVAFESGGQFTFAQGAANNPQGIKFAGEIHWYEVKTTFNLIWRYVPEDFVLDTVSYDFGYPSKILAAAGMVNQGTFAGYPEGTLLLLEPKIDRYVSGTLSKTDGTPYFYCDVVLPIIHFDPAYYSGAPLYRGHNIKPWRGVTPYLYYLATSDGTTSGNYVYKYADYATLFQHW